MVCTVNSTDMKFATGRTLMASISPSTLIFTFCLTRELQIVVGTPTLWAQHQARNTRIISNVVTARGLYAHGAPRLPPKRGTILEDGNCSRRSSSAFPSPSWKRQAPSWDFANVNLCPCPILRLPNFPILGKHGALLAIGPIPAAALPCSARAWAHLCGR